MSFRSNGSIADTMFSYSSSMTPKDRHITSLVAPEGGNASTRMTSAMVTCGLCGFKGKLWLGRSELSLKAEMRYRHTECLPQVSCSEPSSFCEGKSVFLSTLTNRSYS